MKLWQSLIRLMLIVSSNNDAIQNETTRATAAEGANATAIVMQQ